MRTFFASILWFMFKWLILYILLIFRSCREKLKSYSIKNKVMLKSNFGMQVILDGNLPVLVKLDPNYKARWTLCKVYQWFSRWRCRTDTWFRSYYAPSLTITIVLSVRGDSWRKLFLKVWEGTPLPDRQLEENCSCCSYSKRCESIIVYFKEFKCPTQMNGDWVVVRVCLHLSAGPCKTVQKSGSGLYCTGKCQGLAVFDDIPFDGITLPHHGAGTHLASAFTSKDFRGFAQLLSFKKVENGVFITGRLAFHPATTEVIIDHETKWMVMVSCATSTSLCKCIKITYPERYFCTFR